jgi:hypothetical protein
MSRRALLLEIARQLGAESFRVNQTLLIQNVADTLAERNDVPYASGAAEAAGESIDGFDDAEAEEGEAKTTLAKTPPTGALSKENFTLINRTHNRFCKTMAKGAEMSFLIGRALFEIKMNRDQGIFRKDFVRDNFDFSVRAADNHIRMYERFKDNPDAIKDKTIGELNGEKERVKREYNRIGDGAESGGP